MTFDRRRALTAASTASTVVVRRGTGPLGWLGLLFVVLKLFEVTAVATWSWWVVLLPLYLPYAIVLGIWALILVGIAVFLVGGITCIAIAHLWEKLKYRKRRAESKAFRIKRQRY